MFVEFRVCDLKSRLAITIGTDQSAFAKSATNFGQHVAQIVRSQHRARKKARTDFAARVLRGKLAASLARLSRIAHDSSRFESEYVNHVLSPPRRPVQKR
jgi:CMP-N-acetylneuraminic acid synthetase